MEHGTNPGPSTVLTAEEEGALAAYLLYMAERGFSLTSNMARGFAWVLSLRLNGSTRKQDLESTGGATSDHGTLNLLFGQQTIWNVAERMH